MSDAEEKDINEPGETDFAPESVEATDESEAAGEEAAGEEAVAEKKPLTIEEQLEEIGRASCRERV